MRRKRRGGRREGRRGVGSDVVHRARGARVYNISRKRRRGEMGSTKWRGGEEEAIRPYEGINRSFIRERARGEKKRSKPQLPQQRWQALCLSRLSLCVGRNFNIVVIFHHLLFIIVNLYHACIHIIHQPRWREGSRRRGRGPAKVPVFATPTLHPILENKKVCPAPPVLHDLTPPHHACRRCVYLHVSLTQL